VVNPRLPLLDEGVSERPEVRDVEHPRACTRPNSPA
jgi:hypothetical protein